MAACRSEWWGVERYDTQVQAQIAAAMLNRVSQPEEIAAMAWFISSPHNAK